MTTQINKPAIGFLGMLEAKQMGRTPAIVAEQILGQVDMFPFWEAYDMTVDVLVGANLLPSTSSQIIGRYFVPDDEAWVPLHFSVEGVIETIAGQTQFDLNVSRPPRATDLAQTLQRLATGPLLTSVIANQFVSLTYSWQQRLLLMPGMFLDGICRDLIGSNLLSNRTRLTYYRIPL